MRANAELCVALCLLLSVCLQSGCSEQEEVPGAPEQRAITPQGPNLVLVVIDTLRADHLGPYGYARPTSPQIDRVAKDCVVFEQAQSTAPWTASSITSIMTSLHPDAHGVQSFPAPEILPESASTLAEYLSSHGYATAAFTEGGYAKPGYGLERGFETYPAGGNAEYGYASNLAAPSQLSGNVDHSLEWIAEQGDAPFFLFFHTYEVHTPLRPPDEYIRLFRPDHDGADERHRIQSAIDEWRRTERIGEEEAYMLRRHVANDPLSEFQGAIPPERLASAHPQLGESLYLGSRREEFLRWFVDLYDAEIAYTDDQLGRLFTALDSVRSTRPTLLVIVSDHGEGLGQHGALEHGQRLNEELLHVPLLICGVEGVTSGSRRSELVSTLDIMPTLLDLIGVSYDAGAIQGRSLLTLLGGEAWSARPVHGQSMALAGEERRHHTLRSERWRFIRDADTGVGELYDRTQDRGEERDVAGVHPGTVSELGALIDARMRDSSARSAGRETRQSVMDEATRAQLRALGYIDDSDDPASP